MAILKRALRSFFFASNRNCSGSSSAFSPMLKTLPSFSSILSLEDNLGAGLPVAPPYPGKLAGASQAFFSSLALCYAPFMSEQESHPIGGIDYPRTLQEFDEWFWSEEACASYIFRPRWPEGFRCPACHGSKGWLMATGLIRCAECKQKTSVIAGTIFQGTRKPLRLWFQAIWYITSQKFGGSALGLKRVLGLGSYQTS